LKGQTLTFATSQLAAQFVPAGTTVYNAHEVSRIEFMSPVTDDEGEPAQGPGGVVRTCARNYGTGQDFGRIADTSNHKWPQGYVEVENRGETSLAHKQLCEWGIEQGLITQALLDQARTEIQALKQSGKKTQAAGKAK
jgi:hypothetical protein